MLNNVPEQNNYKELGSFRFWCQKVLPLTYDDSLSYYELLSKVVSFLNTTIENMQYVGEDTNKLYTSYTELLNYVNTYFNNLDLQNEIDKKLDIIASNGVLSNIVSEYLGYYASKLERDVNGMLGGKVDIDGNQQIKMANLSQEVRVAMTGGSVAVVGTDAVNTDNVTNGAITVDKLSNKLRANIVPVEGVSNNYTIEGAYYDTTGLLKIYTDANNTKSCGEMSVQVNDILYFTDIFRSDTDRWFAIPAIVLMNGDTAIKSYKGSDLFNLDGTRIIEYLTIPSNCNRVLFNTPINYLWTFYKVTGFAYKDVRYETTIPPFMGVVTPEIEDGVFYNRFYYKYEFTGYKTYIYPCNYGDIFNVSATIPANVNFALCIWLDKDKKAIGFAEPIGTTALQPVTKNVVAPPLAKYMCVSQNGVVPVVYKYGYSDMVEVNKGVQFAYLDGVLTVNQSGTTYTFNKFGPNNLMMCSAYGLKESPIRINTDILSPYIIKATRNGNGDREHTGFTGGNHGYNDDNTGSATATTINVEIFADNNPISNGLSNTCDTLTMYVTNLIQATNTCLEAGGGRNVLQEKVTYTFNGKEMLVNVVITALEEIEFVKYYSLQLSGFTKYNVYADKCYFNQTSTPAVNSKPYAITGVGDGVNITMELSDAGIGDYKMNNIANKMLIMSYGKAYYYPISGGTLLPGESIYYTGKYIVSKANVI